MEISVIIPTYNGATKIVNALASLREQSFSRFEVIVVVDGSADNTTQVLTEITQRMPNLMVREIPNAGRAGAKNEGVLHARANVLVFMDDDIRLFPNALALHYEFHQKNQGQMLLGRLEMDPAKAFMDDFLNYRRTIESSWGKGRESQITFTNFAFTSANMSVTKDDFQRIGGFDRDLRDSEDFDFGIRALLLGTGIHYDSRIGGFHDDFATLPQYMRRQHEYIQAKLQLLEKRPLYKSLLPDQFRWVDVLPADRMKKMIFSGDKFWKSLFATKSFKVLPKSLRYSLYSAFIHVQTVVLNRK